MATRAEASNTRLQRPGKARRTVRHTAPPPLSRYPLDRLSEASVHRQESFPQGPGHSAHRAPPNPFPLGPVSVVCRATALARRIPVGNASQTRWSSTELQRTPYGGRFRRRGR